MKISIPKPCTESWSAMTPAEQGRHCAACNKVVFDFTAMSDRELLEYFKTRGKTCGRFRGDQLNRVIVEPRALPKSRFWRFIGALALFFISAELSAQTNTKETAVVDSSQVPVRPPEWKKSPVRFLKVQVTGSITSQPLQGVRVSSMDFEGVVFTDKSGEAQLPLPYWIPEELLVIFGYGRDESQTIIVTTEQLAAGRVVEFVYGQAEEQKEELLHFFTGRVEYRE